MAKAFLSHSSKDKPLIEKIALQLGRNNCHYDSLTFEAGEKTIEEIFRSLEDTDIFVLFISNDSLESEWVKKEITHAKKLSSRSIIERIFPLIIDRNISHRDTRIPDWIKKPYNIRHFENEVIILKKIRQFLRESNFKKFSHLRELNDLFVGRYDIIQDFERKIINIENTKPTCIVASSYFDGMGRRTFIKNGLIKTGLIDKWYDPVLIPINSKESIEDFIYKLNFINNSSEIFEHDFSTMDLSKKIEMATKIVKQYVDINEIIFIVDEGSIVLPNHQFVGWFKEIISHSSLLNQISICLISRFKPHGLLVKKMGNVLSFQVNELSIPDTQTFFIQYLKLLGLTLGPEDIKFFLKYLKGIPGQIIYASNLIESMSVFEAKRNVQDIEEFDEFRALSILEFLDQDELSRQILIALSKFEIISYDLVYRIFGESDEVYKAIQKLFDLSLFFTVSSTHEYLKLNTSIADYINRSRLELNRKYSERIKEIAKEAILKPIELNEYSDYSEFLFALQNLLISNSTVPPKFLIPSFILKAIVQEYYNHNYNTVIELAKKILENTSKFDYQIIRETRNWLCLAYARTNDDKFFEEIGFFKDEPYETNKDYYFLLGFYFRNYDNMDKAEEYYLSVLDIDPNHSKAKRELVNVYLRNRNYSKALNWARDNYYQFRTNILHIQAYFICLIKKHDLAEEDIEILQELLINANKSLDRKAQNIYKEMQAEFDFYVNGNFEKAVNALTDSLKINPRNYYAFKGLLEIYKRKNMNLEIEKLITKHSDLFEPEYE
jgi:tetratricopeptide (TPR) repeat protein